MGNTIMAVIGICGGLLCAIADCLLDLKGADNKKLGKGGYIDSKWEEMAHWRFVASDIVAMFAIPMYSCGFLALMSRIATEHKGFAITASVIFLCGAMGGFMIHTFVCLMPTIYKDIMATSTFALAEKVISDTFKQIYVPFISLYCLLVIVPSGMVAYAILAGILPLPLWCILFNPVVFQLVGLLLRATKLKCFIDAPSICAASLGLAMYGVLALIL
ncbi:MAG: hypothetical protein LKJ90_03975 [Faecalibacterium sp.]|jgi:hypothetical protein|nr:hypothetical protein [Faecalibacterium sp.]